MCRVTRPIVIELLEIQMFLLQSTTTKGSILACGFLTVFCFGVRLSLIFISRYYYSRCKRVSGNATNPPHLTHYLLRSWKNTEQVEKFSQWVELMYSLCPTFLIVNPKSLHQRKGIKSSSQLGVVNSGR